LEQAPDTAEQTAVEIKPSLEEVCSIAAESKPVAEEKKVHEEEVSEKEIQPPEPRVVQEEIQPAEPRVVQGDVAEKLEAVEHPEHTETAETEADMTGSSSAPCIFSLVLLSAILRLH
jgi:hypothetical protein